MSIKNVHLKSHGYHVYMNFQGKKTSMVKMTICHAKSINKLDINMKKNPQHSTVKQKIDYANAIIIILDIKYE